MLFIKRILQVYVLTAIIYCFTASAEPEDIASSGFFAWVARSQVMSGDSLLISPQAFQTSYASAQRIANATPMLKYYADELKAHGVPLDFVILPLIESGNNPQAKSPASALGLWQFMPTTGREWGLKRLDGVDERVDVQKSTAAAARFIQSLYHEFGDWNLVLAAYNWGPASVHRALRKGLRAPGGKINLSYLPSETRNYLISFYAFNRVISEGWSKEPLRRYPNQSYLIRINPSHLQGYLSATPGLSKVNESVLRQLNGLDSQAIHQSSRPMLVPTRVFAQYFMPDRVAFGAGSHRMSQSACNAPSSLYQVKRGETLEIIARKFKMSLSKLIDLNPEVRFARPGIALHLC